MWMWAEVVKILNTGCKNDTRKCIISDGYEYSQLIHWTLKLYCVYEIVI